MVAALVPNIVATLKSRIGTVRAEIREALKECRLNGNVPLKRFALRLKNRFELIQALEHEIVRHDTTFAVSVPDVMQALFDVVTSVRRWSDLEQLRAERANLERETTAEFIEHEQRLTGFAKGPIGVLRSGQTTPRNRALRTA